MDIPKDYGSTDPNGAPITDYEQGFEEAYKHYMEKRNET